ncbi:MAG: SDR family oxidoreductase [Chloroflexi bacterium]|nr:SDR family oxidoreductase [Chloroflexota bacterium]
MELGLRGKVALITGGSEGIGKATGLRMAQEGGRVAICARRTDVLDQAAEEIRRATEGEVLPVVADVANAEDIKRMVRSVAEHWGRIDILVNNAGTSAASLFEEVSEEGWQADFELKVFAAIRCTREVLPYMKAQRWGRIVNVTNLGGKAPGSRSLPTSVSRAAGIALTKALSKDYAEHNILVNTVCIGLIKSGQHERRYQRSHAQQPTLGLEEYYAQMAKGRVPLGRVGEALEAADVITFLCSERASYVTGVAVNIDGGTSAVV